MATQTDDTFVVDHPPVSKPEYVNSDPGPIDLQREYDFLRNLIKQVQDKFVGEWMGSQLPSRMNQQCQLYSQKMEQNEEMLASMNERLKKLGEQKHENKKALAEQQEEVISLNKQLKTVQLDLDELLRNREGIQERLSQAQSETNQEKEVVSQQRKVAMETTTELEKAAGWFRDRLGLQLKKVTGDRLQLVFTYIDKKNPSKPYCFCVKINPDRTYTVSDCDPMVSDFDELVTKLNHTNNFQSFVASMRRRFKDLV